MHRSRAVTIVASFLVAAAAVAAVGGGGGIAAVADGVTGAGETVVAERVSERRVERAIHDRVNELRAARGVAPLGYANRTAAAARNHSTSMAAAGALSHSDLNEQYPCREVGENVAYTYAARDIQTANGTVNHYSNETAIADGIVRQWMHSEPHRETLLDPAYSGQGIGVASNWSDDGQRVYATQALCG
jgi:uncharacterized protein YkwD